MHSSILRTVLPPDRALPGLVPGEGYQDILVEQAEKWLADAAASVSDDIVADTHVSFNESFSEGLIGEAVRLGAEAIVVGGSGGGLVGSLSLGSVVNELLQKAPVPVVLAPRGVSPLKRRPGPRSHLRRRRTPGCRSAAPDGGAQ